MKLNLVRREVNEVAYGYPYSDWPYWGRGRCRWFPWLPRWWWSGMYGPISPYGAGAYGTPQWGMPSMTKDQEVAMLEDQASALEKELEEVKKRIQEIKA